MGDLFGRVMDMINSVIKPPMVPTNSKYLISPEVPDRPKNVICLRP